MARVLPRSVDTIAGVHTELLNSIYAGTRDLAAGLGMESDSVLHEKAHKRLVAQLQEVAVMDSKLEMKAKASHKVMKALALEMDRKRTSGPAAAAEEEVSMEYFLQRMSDSVSAAMEGADETVPQSKRYKDHMKHVTTVEGEDDDDDMVIDRGNKVSLICPLTSVVFKEPVKSKACNHTFEKAAILNHIKIAEGGVAAGNGVPVAACPVAGCTRKVRSADLMHDEAMKRLLRIESQTEQTAPVMEAEEIDDSFGETYI